MKKYKNRGIDFGGLSLTDPEKYRKIYDVLSERGVKEDLLDIVDTVPLEYAYDLADDAPDAEDVVATAELKKVVTEVLSTLKPREERILRKRFGIGLAKDYTLEEVGEEFCVTRTTIRGIEAKALRKLKHPSKSEKLRSFLVA
jgi:RNA polymerase primary sigma factor